MTSLGQVLNLHTWHFLSCTLTETSLEPFTLYVHLPVGISVIPDWSALIIKAGRILFTLTAKESCKKDLSHSSLEFGGSFQAAWVLTRADQFKMYCTYLWTHVMDRWNLDWGSRRCRAWYSIWAWMTAWASGPCMGNPHQQNNTLPYAS